jgi:hypothetical protein
LHRGKKIGDILRKKTYKKNTKKQILELLEQRLKILQSAMQSFEQNQALMKNVRMANIELIQNDITGLKESLRKLRKYRTIV